SILALLIVSNMRPMFRATATILIEQGKSKIVSIEEVYSAGMIQREYYQTQLEIIRSEEMARKVIRKLDLTNHPDFDSRQRTLNWFQRIMSTAERPVVSDEDVMKVAVARFRNALQVQFIRNSQLAQITFTSFDRELAGRAPNVVAETYIE